VVAVEAADRRVYEKLIYAALLVQESWDGRKHRQTLDRCLGWVLEPGDLHTTAYLHYEYLRGRDPDFIPFLRQRLQVGPGDEDALRERYGPLAAAHLAAAAARGAMGPEA